MSNVLQFIPFSSSIDPTFWHALTKLKIDVLKLRDQPVPIQAWYERGRWVQDREAGGTEIGLGGELRLDGKSFELDTDPPALKSASHLFVTLESSFYQGSRAKSPDFF